MKRDLKLSGDITVKDVKEVGSDIQVTAYKTKEPEVGTMTMLFKTNPFQLVHWVVHDMQGNVTQVTLQDIVQNQPLAKDLFVFPG